MLGLVISITVLLAAFVGFGCYAFLNSRERRNKVLNELDERISAEAGEAFNAVFEDEMAQQFRDSQAPDIDSEPVISLSEQAQQIKVDKPKENPRGSSVDITVDDSEEEVIEPARSTDFTVIDWDMVVAFTIIAPEESQPFSGLNLKAAFEKLNFKFGELDIYHRMATGVRNVPLFSIANIRQPGTFDPQDVAMMSTSGILLFAKLPGPINGLSLFDGLLETAQSLSDLLGGKLCDEERKPVNQSTFERMRSRILELNLSMQSEQNQYGNNDYSS